MKLANAEEDTHIILQNMKTEVTIVSQKLNMWGGAAWLAGLVATLALLPE